MNVLRASFTTPLTLACQCGHVECVKLLLKNSNVDADILGEDESTPMHYAILFEHLDYFHSLLECDRIWINCWKTLPRTIFEFALDHFQLESLSSLLKYAYSSSTET